MSNNFVIKILLALVVVAFVAFGVKDALLGPHDLDMAIFSNARNITKYDFLKAKAQEIAALQKQNNINLTEDDIKQLGIDRSILQQLINKSIINYVVKYYDLDLSEKKIIQFIRQAEIFNNEEEKFDINIFHSVLRHSDQTEIEYLRRLREEILKNFVLNIFTTAFFVPEIMVNNIASYNDEQRAIDLVQIDLTIPHKGLVIPTVTQGELRAFYDKYQNLFAISEKRSLAYISITNPMVKKKIKITQEEIRDFFDNNREDFPEQNLQLVKKDIEASLTQQKLEELTVELTKNLEDDVASGSSLKEIAEKYDVELNVLNNLTFEDITNSKDTILSQSASMIFEMAEEEVSYPIESDTGILIMEVNKIVKPSIESFDSALNKVEKLWFNEFVREANHALISNALSNYDCNQASYDLLKSQGFKISKNLLITRDLEAKNHKIIPKNLIPAVFLVKKGTNTGIITDEDRKQAYFAHVNSVKIANFETTRPKNDRLSSIAQNIKYGMIEEMIQHFKMQNKMKIKHHNFDTADVLN